MITTNKRMMKRTHTCGSLGLNDEKKSVVLAGWVHRRRDLGGLVFIDLRDREGITQIVFDSNRSKEAHELAQQLNREYVIVVSGVVEKRSPGTENPKLASGAVEVIAKELQIINPCSSPLPISRLDEEAEKFLPGEEVRLKYRYLDLRRRKMLNNLTLRHRVVKSIRDFLDQREFLEVETPMLIRTTPEGARDYLVPSRIYNGKFYALPQSPQLFKQLLMVAGFDKYFQIARCMRDEDLRADRQPEFTQLDLEMSFVEREDVIGIIEELFQYVFEKSLGVNIQIPFPRLSYEEAMNSYGSDKPDLRFDLKIIDLTENFIGTNIKVFEEVTSKKGKIKAIHLRGEGKNFSRKTLDSLNEWVKQEGGKGLFYLLWTEDLEIIKSPLAKNLTESQIKALKSTLQSNPGDVTLLSADAVNPLLEVMGKLRIELAHRLELIPKEKFAFLWVIDFPMFHWNEEEKNLEPMHHPFTSPRPEDITLLDSAPLATRADAYDIVLNGFEVGSGSIRIHDRALQQKIFNLIGLSNEEAQEKFGFLLDAFQFGAPPHGGIAPGVDRLVMLMAGEESIREVIAFPKNQSAQDLMLGAPVEATAKQLKELHLKVER